ncbi:MAG TPA: hypothetical protein VHC19_28255 [Pirellulales bacterium]|nr:hypothetical protein [Pirellulales bacterium]
MKSIHQEQERTGPGAGHTSAARPLWLPLLIGAGVFAVCAVGGWFDPQQFFRAYLATYQFYLGLGLGSLVLLMIYALTGGAWGFLLRPMLESSVRTLPLLAVGFLPIAFGLAYIYPWMHSDLLETSEKLQKQQGYLNESFFLVRAAVYFAVWLVPGWLLVRWLRLHRQSGEHRYWFRCLNLAGPGLVLYGLAIHFASIDWVMSLQSDFHSTIFGPLTAAGHVLSAFALAVCALPAMSRRPTLDAVLSPKALNDMGNLLLSFVVIWMYMEWFQFMLVWIANVQVDVVWYGPRMRNGWQWVFWALVLLHFAVPFGALLLRRVKQNLAAMRTVAVLVLAMHLVFSYYQVLPAYGADSLRRHWMDFLLPIGWGCIWGALFAYRLRGADALAQHDPNAHEALHLRELDEEEAQWDKQLQHV